MLSEVVALVGPDTAHDRGPSANTVQTADTGSALMVVGAVYYAAITTPSS
jgi:hypothetical protein